MTERLENKKIILVAFNAAELRDRVARSVADHLPGATIFTAGDGVEAWMKMNNLPPHLVILERGLAKLEGLQLSRDMVGDKKFDHTALIFFDDPPEEETLVDEIVTGRLQFLTTRVEDGRFARALAKALNDIAAREETNYRLRFLAPGDRLIEEGDRSRHVYLVKRGRLKAVNRKDQTEVLLGEVEPGEFVGEMAYINHEPRSADVLALTDCELIEISAEHLDHELYRKPSWAKALMLTLSKRIKRANQEQSSRTS